MRPDCGVPGHHEDETAGEPGSLRAGNFRPGRLSMSGLWSALRAAVTSACVFGLLAAPAGAAQADRCPGSLDVPTGPQTLDTASGAILCLVNAERTSRGLP